MDTVTLKLRGMSCAACATGIEQTLRSLPGVEQCSVNFGAELATVQYDAAQTNVAQMQDAVDEAGYAAVPLQDEDLLAGEDEAEQRANRAESRD